MLSKMERKRKKKRKKKNKFICIPQAWEKLESQNISPFSQSLVYLYSRDKKIRVVIIDGLQQFINLAFCIPFLLCSWGTSVNIGWYIPETIWYRHTQW
jgi:hypothetical protein